MRKFVIYMHKNKTNGKIQIGQTCQDPRDRWDNGWGQKTQHPFFDDIQKQGWKEGFEHIILEEDLTQEEANERETYYIKEYNSLYPNGYNLEIGGGKHFKEISELTKQRLSEKVKAAWTRPEYRELRIAQNKKAWENPEMREKCLKNLDRTGECSAKKTRKKVRCVETGQIYDGVRIASRETGICHNNISQVCNGIRQTAGGYHWEWVTENEN